MVVVYWILTHSNLNNVIQDIVIDIALSIVHITFLKKSSAWRWFQTDEPKHVAERYDWKYNSIWSCVRLYYYIYITKTRLIQSDSDIILSEPYQ